MSRNPYQPPESPVATAEVKRDPGAIGVIIVVLTALQVIGSSVYAAAGLEMVKVGELSPFSFLMIVASVASLATGGVLLVLNRPASRYSAALAVILSALLLFGSHSILHVAQVVVAACLTTFSIIHFRVSDA